MERRPDRGPDKVFLIGPMGSGKTTLGRRVAEALGLAFHDCDDEIERQTGASVNLIFDIEGEAGFRERESRMLDQLTRRDRVLVATGGGAVLQEINRQRLRARGLVVWLHTTVDQQLERLRQDRQRPLLQTPDRRAKLEALAADRDPLYAEVAHLDFRPQPGSLTAVAGQLVAAIRAAGKSVPKSESETAVSTEREQQAEGNLADP